PPSTLFPYTTLFRSEHLVRVGVHLPDQAAVPKQVERVVNGRLGGGRAALVDRGQHLIGREVTGIREQHSCNLQPLSSGIDAVSRSEEHTSELQSREN